MPSTATKESEDNAVLEDGGVANATAGDPSASGSFSDHAVATGIYTLSLHDALPISYGTYTFNPTTGAWSYTLNQALADPLTAGQIVHDHLVVTSFDEIGRAHV